MKIALPMTLHKSVSAFMMGALLLSTMVYGLIGFAPQAHAEQVCSTVTLTSGTGTQTAGFTETNPASALSAGSYAHAYSAASLTQTQIPPWVDPAVDATFATSGAKWISSHTSWPGSSGNTEGSSTKDQWRLYQDQFTLPANATVSSADVWYSADNAAAFYSNGSFVGRTGTSSDDVFGAIPAGNPANYATVFHNTFSPTTGLNTLNFVVRNWLNANDTNPTGLLYKAVINYCVPVNNTPTTGSLTVTKVVSGGSASPANFMIHVMKNGSEIAGSPQAGSASGTAYNNLATSTYVVSETGGPSGYTTTFSGDCDTNGSVTVVASTTKNCTITNTYASTTVPTGSGTINVIKWVGGGSANASNFQMHVTYSGVEVSGSPKAGSTSGAAFGSLGAGTYTVSETGGPDNYTPYFFGDCTSNGSVVLTDGATKNCYVVNIFSQNSGNNAGSIAGTVYNDLNHNEVRDAGEPGIAGFTIKLYKRAGWSGPKNVSPVKTAVTDANGNYSFTSLADGTYSIEEINKSGWHQETRDYSPVKISGGAVLTGKDFGNTEKKAEDKSKDKDREHKVSTSNPGNGWAWGKNKDR